MGGKYSCFANTDCTGTVVLDGDTGSITDFAEIDIHHGKASSACTAAGAKSYRFLGSNGQSLGTECNALATSTTTTATATVGAWGTHVDAMKSAGWDNVALGASTTATSEYTSAYSSKLATDGTGKEGNFSKVNGYHSSSADSKPALSINLGKDYLIGQIDVYNRTDENLGTRFKNILYEVLNDGKVVYTSPTIASPAHDATVTNLTKHVLPSSGTVGDTIRITKTSSAGTDQILNLGEIEVWGKAAASATLFLECNPVPGSTTKYECSKTARLDDAVALVDEAAFGREDADHDHEADADFAEMDDEVDVDAADMMTPDTELEGSTVDMAGSA
eukprot:tig00000178_g12785.t1